MNKLNLATHFRYLLDTIAHVVMGSESPFLFSLVISQTFIVNNICRLGYRAIGAGSGWMGEKHYDLWVNGLASLVPYILISLLESL